MPRNTLLGFIMLTVAACASGAAGAAETTLHQVYQAAESGRMTEAQAMMDQVLRDHPDSAKAHFVEAELLARQGRIADARKELATAERLAPGLPFAKPQTVQNLKARLAMTTAPAEAGGRAPAPAAPAGFPWGLALLGLGLVAFILFAVRLMGRRSATPVPAAPAYGQPGYGPGAAMPPYPAAGATGGGLGSGLLGGLATGAAVGAGMVAGEALMHRVLDGRGGEAQAAPLAHAGPASYPDDLGGQDFGVGGDSWDDSAPDLGGDDWN
jgi:hypothetical protein